MRRSVSAKIRSTWIANVNEDTTYDVMERNVAVVAIQRMLKESEDILGPLLAPKVQIEKTVTGGEDWAPDCIGLKSINR